LVNKDRFEQGRQLGGDVYVGVSHDVCKGRIRTLRIDVKRIAGQLSAAAKGLVDRPARVLVARLLSIAGTLVPSREYRLQSRDTRTRRAGILFHVFGRAFGIGFGRDELARRRDLLAVGGDQVPVPVAARHLENLEGHLKLSFVAPDGRYLALPSPARP
jgi:hypothetical protein